MKLLVISIVIAIGLAAEAQQSQYQANQKAELDYLTSRIEEEPDNIYWYSARANIYDNRNDFTASNEDYKKALALYIENPLSEHVKIAANACYFLADDYYFRNSNKIAASKFLEIGMDIAPKDKRFEVIQVGIMGTYPDKKEEVQRKFEEMILKYPNDEKLYQYYGKFLERVDAAKSAIYYQNAATINPNNTDALFALGAYHINEAGRVYNTSGNALKALEHTERGISFLERVHELIPHNTEIIEMLIQSYENINRTDDVARMEQKLHPQESKTEQPKKEEPKVIKKPF